MKLLPIFLALPFWNVHAELLTLPLWTSEIPGEKEQKVGKEKVEDRNNDGITRTSNVSKPTITIYPAHADKTTGAAVIVAPGGGYSILASKHEGTDVCTWLNEIGVTAVLLKYRVPRRKNLEKHHAPMQDAQRAVSLVRSKASEWKIDPKRIGLLGFSAGGHLTATVLTSDGSVSFPKEEVDKHSPIPNFGLLIYPAYLKNEEDRNKLVPEVSVDKNTPPSFVVIAHGDSRFVEGAALYYLAMHRAKCDCELHIYGKGGHGYGMKKIPQRVGEWTTQAGGWMKEMGYLD
ncbi:MAG: alpha/beta hydrolase [Akkermansiaceae bacterium]|nr:alpha/beta hydrolase [Akkermansiaceae bacterium]